MKLPFSRRLATAELVKFLEDLATDNFGNPFQELARIKIITRNKLKEIRKEKSYGSNHSGTN